MNCICMKCNRIMDCSGELYCELCEVVVENEKQRVEQEMKRMQAYDVPNLGEHQCNDEVWDTQP